MFLFPAVLASHLKEEPCNFSSYLGPIGPTHPGSSRIRRCHRLSPMPGGDQVREGREGGQTDLCLSPASSLMSCVALDK